MKRVLQVFAKAPVPGQVKTRLHPALGSAGAAALQRALIERTLTLATAAYPGTVDQIELWCAPDTTHPFFAECAQRFPITLRTQPTADLGLRMQQALADALARDCLPVLVGTDCPALTVAELAQAFDALGGSETDSALCAADIVLLPTEDGGYALIGARRLVTALFDGIAWSTSEVSAQTRSRIAALGWRLHELETGWDVDRPHDLVRLRALVPALLDNIESRMTR